VVPVCLPLVGKLRNHDAASPMAMTGTLRAILQGSFLGSFYILSLKNGPGC
jgi:hypothetical protein